MCVDKNTNVHLLDVTSADDLDEAAQKIVKV